MFARGNVRDEQPLRLGLDLFFAVHAQLTDRRFPVEHGVIVPVPGLPEPLWASGAFISRHDGTRSRK